MTLRFPAGVDTQSFLAQYWQRKPLLLPAALTTAVCDLSATFSAEDLAGLACSENVEARLLRSAGPPGQWRLQHGPFDDETFRQLPATDWTLLVQDVDKMVPAVADLLRHFAFLPSWRIDDIMVSYATPGGTVGPHIDQYDVFLIQGAGSRVWETGRSGGALIADSPVRVLKDFVVEQSWQLKSGDVLYLPPGLAHHGYSTEACLTVSVGFRAPSAAELLLSQAESRAERLTGRYHDEDLSLDEAGDGLISAAAIDRARALLSAQPETRAEAAVWFGRLVTENKPWLQPPVPDKPETRAQFVQRLKKGERLQKHPGVRMAHSHVPGQGMLYVDGTTWPLTESHRSIVPAICRGDILSADTTESAELLHQLYCEGKLYWPDDE